MLETFCVVAAEATVGNPTTAAATVPVTRIAPSTDPATRCTFGLQSLTSTPS